MGLVVTSAFPSVRAFLDKSCDISVSLTSLYNKLQSIETEVSAELVRHTAQQLQPLIEEIGGALPKPIPGYQMHVLDGNNIAATEHRLEETRGNSAPLPGKSLCVFRPAHQLVTHIVPCEDGHTQERALVDPILDLVTTQALCGWPITFCFQRFSAGHRQKLGFFVIREHASLNYKLSGKLRKRGQSETGEIFQQAIVIEDEEGVKYRFRRIVVKLKKATEDNKLGIGDSDEPAEERVGSRGVGSLSEKMDHGGRLPVSDYNLELRNQHTVLSPRPCSCSVWRQWRTTSTSAIKGVMRSEHGAEKVENDLSRYFVAGEIGQVYRGMMVALPPEEWVLFRHMSLNDYIAFLKELARTVDFDRYPKKHIVGLRKQSPNAVHDPEHPHVSVAKLLFARKLKETG